MPPVAAAESRRSAAALALVLAASLGAVASQHCAALRQHYDAAGDRHVVVGGAPARLHVHGEGGGARAAAALLAVLLRHVLRYGPVLRETGRATLCQLAQASDREPAALRLAPAVARGPACRPHPRRVSALSRAAAPTTLRAHARFALPPPADACTTPFAAETDAVRNCAFATAADIYCEPETNNLGPACARCVAVLARNETAYDSVVLAAASDLVRKDFCFKSFPTDLSFRRELLRLRHLNLSFLFLDEELWAEAADVYGVQMPFRSRSPLTSVFEATDSVRVGDGFLLEKNAPDISRAVRRFSPTPEHLRSILDAEAAGRAADDEEAACLWAAAHRPLLAEWLLPNDAVSPPSYTIIVYLCEGDLASDYYDLINVTGAHIDHDIDTVKFGISFAVIECREEEEVMNAFTSLLSDSTVAAVVAWARMEKLEAAERYARRCEVPLVLAGSGPADLARALRHFFVESQWMRFAIISDGSRYAKSLQRDLTDGAGFSVYEVTVARHSVHSVLDTLRKRDARVFLVNANWSITAAILCAAARLGMMSDDKFAWVVTDWRGPECNETEPSSYRHYSLGTSWRGGPAFLESSASLREKLRSLWNASRIAPGELSELGGPPGAAPLVDALLRAAHGFARFYRSHRYRPHDLRGRGSTEIFFQHLEQIEEPGVAQTLSPSASNGTLIYVDEWRGARGSSLAVWQIRNDTVNVIWSRGDALVGARRVRDASPCYAATRSDDGFTRRCHDVVVFSAVALVLVAVPALVVAQRARRDRRRRRQLENHRRNAGTLVTYLVDRHSIKLLHEIGSGTFGRVHFAELKRPGQSTVVVAAKEPHERIAHSGESQFLREACVLAPLSHKNVIRLVGVCLVDGPPTVLMEHALYLDLQRYLTERKYLIIEARLAGSSTARAAEVSDAVLTRMAREAAAALEYLAAQRLVHRDVRAANCLVDKDRSLKLADFGMARKLTDKELEYETTRRGLFPVLWMAPESLELGVFSTASDVWALGVLFLEIVTLGARPFGDWPPARALRHIIEGGHPPLPPDISMPVRNVLVSCWRPAAEARPSARCVRRYLADQPRVFTPAYLAATTELFGR